MPDPWYQRRPRLAYPFTLLTGPDTVRLVAGEDYRYTLTAPALDLWLPALLQQMNGQGTLADLLTALTPEQRTAAMQVIRHLYGERVLVDGSATDAHAPRLYHVRHEGQGMLHALLSRTQGPEAPAGSLSPLVVLTQDRLDYEEVLYWNRLSRAEGMPFLWVSYGPLHRAYVSPLFLPRAGPCFGCLLQSFQRLSPAPEIYDALRDHARQHKPMAPADFPHEGLLVLQGLLAWKLREAEQENPAPALYRLHVLEREHFEVSTHRVFMDPLCPVCSQERP